MIRLHMLYNQIIRLPAAKYGRYVIQPFMRKIAVNRIHHRNLLIQNHIGIVSHAIWHHILPFKQIHFMVVHTHITDVLCNLHIPSPLCFIYSISLKKSSSSPQDQTLIRIILQTLEKVY